jgi:hypothetical protein
VFIFADSKLSDTENVLTYRKQGQARTATRSELGGHIGLFAARQIDQNNSAAPRVCQHVDS